MSELSAFHLLRPWWLLAAVPVGLTLFALLRRDGSISAWRNVIEPQLARHLLAHHAVPWRRWPLLLAAGAWLATIIALAGPTWSRAPTQVGTRDDALVIVLDLSLSMYATDVSPSRLVRAQHAISDLLARRTQGRTALIVYAGDAHIVTPLTDDVRTIENLLPQLQPITMPIAGSNLADALTMARELLLNAQALPGRVLLITDEIGDPTATAQSGDSALSILGVGSSAGSPIPLTAFGRRGEFLQDDQGREVIARLDERRLAAAANRSGGRYRTLGAEQDDWLALLNEPAVSHDTIIQRRTFDVWTDQGFWLLLLVAPIAALAFRRGVVVSLALVALFCAAPSPSHAATQAVGPAAVQAPAWNDLWQRRDQQAMNALKGGQAARAAALFTTNGWQATALYRDRQYQAAAALFADDATADGWYNRGTALAHAGDLSGAIAALDRALALQPRHADAAFNRNLLKRQQQSPANASQQPQSGAQQRHGGARNAQQSQPNGAGRPPSGADDPAAANNASPPNRASSQSSPATATAAAGQRAEQAQRSQGSAERAQLQARDERADEQRRATEQWLRRVPDDPGGLLRRKFTNESSARFVEHRAPPAADKIW